MAETRAKTEPTRSFQAEKTKQPLILNEAVEVIPTEPPVFIQQSPIDAMGSSNQWLTDAELEEMMEFMPAGGFDLPDDWIIPTSVPLDICLPHTVGNEINSLNVKHAAPECNSQAPLTVEDTITNKIYHNVNAENVLGPEQDGSTSDQESRGSSLPFIIDMPEAHVEAKDSSVGRDQQSSASSPRPVVVEGFPFFTPADQTLPDVEEQSDDNDRQTIKQATMNEQRYRTCSFSSSASNSSRTLSMHSDSEETPFVADDEQHLEPLSLLRRGSDWKRASSPDLQKELEDTPSTVSDESRYYSVLTDLNTAESDEERPQSAAEAEEPSRNMEQIVDRVDSAVAERLKKFEEKMDQKAGAFFKKLEKKLVRANLTTKQRGVRRIRKTCAIPQQTTKITEHALTPASSQSLPTVGGLDKTLSASEAPVLLEANNHEGSAVKPTEERSLNVVENDVPSPARVFDIATKATDRIPAAPVDTPNQDPRSEFKSKPEAAKSAVQKSAETDHSDRKPKEQGETKLVGRYPVTKDNQHDKPQRDVDSGKTWTKFLLCKRKIVEPQEQFRVAQSKPEFYSEDVDAPTESVKMSFLADMDIDPNANMLTENLAAIDAVVASMESMTIGTELDHTTQTFADCSSMTESMDTSIDPGHAPQVVAADTHTVIPPVQFLGVSQQDQHFDSAATSHRPDTEMSAPINDVYISDIEKSIAVNNVYISDTEMSQAAMSECPASGVDNYCPPVEQADFALAAQAIDVPVEMSSAIEQQDPGLPTPPSSPIAVWSNACAKVVRHQPTYVDDPRADIFEPLFRHEASGELPSSENGQQELVTVEPLLSYIVYDIWNHPDWSTRAQIEAQMTTIARSKPSIPKRKPKDTSCEVVSWQTRSGKAMPVYHSSRKKWISHTKSAKPHARREDTAYLRCIGRTSADFNGGIPAKFWPIYGDLMKISPPQKPQDMCGDIVINNVPSLASQAPGTRFQCNLNLSNTMQFGKAFLDSQQFWQSLRRNDERVFGEPMWDFFLGLLLEHCNANDLIDAETLHSVFKGKPFVIDTRRIDELASGRPEASAPYMVRVAYAPQDHQQLLMSAFSKIQEPAQFPIFRRYLNNVLSSLSIHDTDHYHSLQFNRVCGVAGWRNLSAKVSYEWEFVHFLATEWTCSVRPRDFGEEDVECMNLVDMALRIRWPRLYNEVAGKAIKQRCDHIAADLKMREQVRASSIVSSDITMLKGRWRSIA